ncbi:N-formylglutamate amidohydrolase [Kitasatospora viridis]|uniref:N-formylglutamate amidohydrolase n=1 Tax=Kitasatospora viridis TaxID=281105 RepID=A0A561TW93_9ACTN|nr:N-formylglutamate amidohydrolase [Kitasatospora viridis]TWF91380.1 N-formylglutamate amidohydrolase [Kitasatospora viridis]
MSLGDPLFWPLGRRFEPEELVFYADRGRRSLGEALAEADLIVCTPHAGALVPAELAPFLDPGLTRRLQFDFTDVATSAVTRRWAELDRRVIVVENPHPRMVRDPNRPEPADLVATLGEAFARVAAAGPGQPVDLSGVDAVRPVMFNFLPLLTPPAGPAELARLADAFRSAAALGVEVYEHTRDQLVERLLERRLRGSDPGPRSCFVLSFHDTMNHTARPDGALCVERAPGDRVPSVVALSNRGDADGEPRGAEPVTMAPALLRSLADAHRAGFAVTEAAQVALNQPYLGSQEVTVFGARFRELADEASRAGATLGAVQAEFSRAYLLGEEATAHLMRPGVDWPAAPADPAVPAALADRIARDLHRSWDLFRAGLPGGRAASGR